MDLQDIAAWTSAAEQDPALAEIVDEPVRAEPG